MIINCPECNKDISDKAISCPNCGYPISRVKHSKSENNIIIEEDEQVSNDFSLYTIKPPPKYEEEYNRYEVTKRFFSPSCFGMICGVIATIISYFICLNVEEILINIDSFVTVFILCPSVGIVVFLLSCLINYLKGKETRTIKEKIPFAEINNEKIYNETYTIPEHFYSNEIIRNFSRKVPTVPIKMWINDDKLVIISDKYNQDFGILFITLKSVSFFNRLGDFYVTSNITSERKGRLLGGLVAGDVGFIMGTGEQITTTHNEVDKRETVLYLERNGVEDILVFNSDAYNYFLKVIPQFEYNNVIMKQQHV